MAPEQIHTVREAITWARTNGWHRVGGHALARDMGAYTIHVRWASAKYELTISRINHAGPAVAERLWTDDRVRDIEQGIDLLVSLRFLPLRFHSAYVAGRRATAREAVARA